METVVNSAKNDTKRDRACRIRDCRLYVLVDASASVDAFETLVQSLVASAVGAIQLREKNLADRELVDRARRLRAATAGTKTLSIMNDRPDLAVLSDADGVHVGQDELTVPDVRQVVGDERLVGVSTHSLEQAHQAELDGADYIGVGPTFPSRTKEFARFPGPELLESVAQHVQLPAFAIGGITLDRLSEVLDTGIRRTVIGAAITADPDPSAAARQFLTRLEAR
jgi:thiamine-phosphate pyrophosphorylase